MGEGTITVKELNFVVVMVFRKLSFPKKFLWSVQINFGSNNAGKIKITTIRTEII